MGYRLVTEVKFVTNQTSYITAVGRAATVKSEPAASIAAVCPGSSTVPATVIIVVEHRTCLPVGRLIVGVQARLFSRWVAGVQARQLSDSGSSTVLASGSDSG